MAKVDLDALRDLAGLVEDYDVIAPKNCSWEGPDDWPSAKAYRDALRAAADELALARAEVEGLRHFMAAALSVAKSIDADIEALKYRMGKMLLALEADAERAAAVRGDPGASGSGEGT